MTGKQARTAFEEAVKGNPWGSYTGTYVDWLSEIAQTIERWGNVKEDLILLHQAEQHEEQRHRQSMADCRARRKQLQIRCPHDNVKRPTAECQPTCQDCGAEL